MNIILNYLIFKEKMEEYNKINNNFNNISKINEYIKNYNLLINKYLEISKLKRGPFTTIKPTFDDFIDSIHDKLKQIYFIKMNNILSIQNYENSLGYMRGFYDEIINCNKQHLKGLINCFIDDIQKVIKNYPEIYINFNKTINKSRDYNNYLSTLYNMR